MELVIDNSVVKTNSVSYLANMSCLISATPRLSFVK